MHLVICSICTIQLDPTDQPVTEEMETEESFTGSATSIDVTTDATVTDATATDATVTDATVTDITVTDYTTIAPGSFVQYFNSSYIFFYPNKNILPSCYFLTL